MLTIHPRDQKDLDEHQLLQELHSRLQNNLDTTKNALVKIMSMGCLKEFDNLTPRAQGHADTSFNDYLQNFPAIILGLKKSSDLRSLCSNFLALLYMPFGIRLIDSRHLAYMNSRAISQQRNNNDDDDLFQGTASRRYVHGFSNHAYTFGYYLSLNRHRLSNEELSCIVDLFYYGYIKENYHSYCEVDAAFLRISENYNYPELTCSMPNHGPIFVEEVAPLDKSPSVVPLETPLSPHQYPSQKSTRNEKVFGHFNAQLAGIKAKAKELSTNNKIASDEATTLYRTLKTLKNNYAENAITLQHFQLESKKAISRARPVLEVHRGCKELLGNLALAVLGIGVIYLAVCAYKGRFFKFNTDSVNQLNRLTDTIEGIAQEETLSLR